MPEYAEAQYFKQRVKILDMLRSGLEAAGFAKVQSSPLEKTSVSLFFPPVSPTLPREFI